MQCGTCGAPVDATGVFPGAKLKCSCGAENVVAQLAARAPSSPSLPRPPTNPGPTGKREASCPRCRRALQGSRVAETFALQCPACAGHFVEHAGLAVLVDDARKKAGRDSARAMPRSQALEKEVRNLQCPTCGGAMTRMTFGRRSGVVVDVCAAHGTWFDGQELAAILAFARDGGLGDLASDRADAARAVLEVGLAVEAANERNQVETVTHVASDVFDLLYLGMRGF